MGRLIDALIAAMTYPSLAMILNRPASRRASHSRFRVIDRAIRRYALMALTTICGIILVVGLLSDRLMILKVFEFVGIRVAIITPLLLTVLHDGLGLSGVAASAGWARRKSVLLARWQEVCGSPVKLGQIVFGLIGLAIVGYIVVRTGNDPGIAVSSSERTVRALLNKVLYVRPRTKEFLFGYPLLMVGLALYYSGRRTWYLLFACAGAIAQADLLNTFCHIHTPLLISVIRAMLGWLLGLALGVVAYLVVDKYIPYTPADMETAPGAADEPHNRSAAGSRQAAFANAGADVRESVLTP